VLRGGGGGDDDYDYDDILLLNIGLISGVTLNFLMWVCASK
jgi:hypothetical protein